MDLPRSCKTRWAERYPALPMTEPAGWQPALQEYRPATSVA